MPGTSTKNGHPAPFPLELVTRLVEMFSFIDDIVLDPFCGSGTTMLAAINEDRSALGVETEEYYCRHTLKRIEKGKTLFHNYDVQYYDISKEPDSYETRQNTIAHP